MLDLDSTSTLTARAGSSAITPLRYNYCPLPGRGRPITRLFNPLTTRVLALHTTCTALHYSTTTTVPAYHPSLTLPSFITLRLRPAPPRHLTPPPPLSIFLHTWIWNPLATFRSDMLALPLV